MASPPDLIILGASTRAAAASAMRAGYRPWCADLFADRDLQAMCPVVRCPSGDYPAGFLRILQQANLPTNVPVLLTGAMENHLAVVSAVAMDRPMLGSGVEAMSLVRQPEALATTPPTPGLLPCRVWRRPTTTMRLGRWLLGERLTMRMLVKPMRSAGGGGIRVWSGGERVEDDEYLQEYIPGRSIAAVFTADGWSARLLGVTEQLIGLDAMGANGRRPFRYCGSIGPLPMDATQRAALSHLGVVLTQRFDLRGLFGVDAILDDKGRVHPVEVNPRYTASVEVLEQATGLVALAKQNPTGSQSTGSTISEQMIVGKAIVYARKDGVAPDLLGLASGDDDCMIADVPGVGEPMRGGHALCTLLTKPRSIAHADFAAARDDCLALLQNAAQRIYTRMEA